MIARGHHRHYEIVGLLEMLGLNLLFDKVKFE